MITQEEYGLLKKYQKQGYRWIARDEDKGLYVYTTKPEKRECEWRTNKFNSSGVYNDDGYRLFQDIKWEDEEPTKIDDLISDYESHQVIVGEGEKVIIPQFVTKWIEKVKGLERPFKLEYLFDTTAMPDDVYDWLDERYGDADILARAWLDGFVIEKEKLYLLELPNRQRLAKSGDDIKFCDEEEWFEKDFKTKLTKAEIEAVDPRLMQFAVEVE